MSTASVVPETWELTGDDAGEVLRSHGRRHLLRDAFLRLRVADGFSHARSLAYATTLLMVEATIAIVGLAVALGDNGASRLVVRTMRAAVPGPGGELLTSAVEQANRAGTSQRFTGLIFGLVAALITGSTLMGQFERGLNRIYGVEQDRPTLQKYGLALALTISVGALAIGAFALLAFGKSIGDSIDNDTANRLWSYARWPVALLLVWAMMTTLFRYSPRRRQPAFSWLAFSAMVSTILWWAVTAGLGAFFTLSSSFGETYGPLAGIIALMLWALLSAIAVLFGGAIAAQLEAVRAGVRQPQSEEKVEESEPSLAPRRASEKVSA
ncbi:MAG TPA: YihY/virulence factor BrkB family protein [Acidimicrobiia bacterium]|nr:YihY/virulence factor BrkB family protein [Acidimicrobiia bacterium]